MRPSVFWAALAAARPLTRSTKILVHCPEATGDSNCDWKCYQAFAELTEQSEYVLGREVKSCLARIDGSCDIPMTSYLTTRLDSYCLVPRDDEGFVYAVVVPRIKDDLSLKTSSEKVVQTSIQIESNSFGQSFCTRTVLYKVGTSEHHFLEDICSTKAVYKSEADGNDHQTFLGFDAPISFGFTKLSLNVTEWAEHEADEYASVGDVPKIVELSTQSNCHAEPVGMQLYYSENFTVNSEDYDDATALIVAPGFLLAAAALFHF